jgi:hypothetical protein
MSYDDDRLYPLTLAHILQEKTLKPHNVVLFPKYVAGEWVDREIGGKSEGQISAYRLIF